MLPLSDRIWRIVTLALAALLCVQVVRIAFRSRPLAHVRIPEVPVWVDTNAPSGPKAVIPPSVSPPPIASSSTGLSHTNLDSNSVANAAASKKKGTPESNTPAGKTNPAPIVATVKTNPVPSLEQANHELLTNSPSTTNGSAAVASAAPGPSNTLGRVSSSPQASNAVAKVEPPRRPMNPFGMPGGPPMAGAELPPETRARIARIVDSEIFAPVMRPLPMALLGIAGNLAFLRAPNGQTGMIKEQEEIGGIKLLRIGTNRVLVMEDGQEKELTIFAGLGGESLLSKPK